MTPFAQAAVSLSQSPELSMAVKATVLIAIGLAAVRVAARSRASVRHLLLAATFGAILTLPLAAAYSLDIPLSVPADRTAGTVPDRATAAPPVPARAVPAGEVPTPRRLPPVSWTRLARGLWIAGAAVFLSRLAWVLWRLRRLRRTGIPWPEMNDALQSLAAEAGVERPVDIVLHEEVPLPLTFGTRRPVLVLPPDARDWSDGDLRRVLVHEIEHVRRRDWAVQTAARAACAAWWFHPLVWVAWRRLSLEAERACDDAVIVREESVDYAEQLVLLARRLSAAHAQPALGMANRSDLSARVSALLDRGQRRGRAGLGMLAGATVAALSLLLTVAPLRAVAVSSAPSVPASSATTGRQARVQRALDRDLYEASLRGDVDGVSALIQAGANVNAVIAGDGSALIGAVRSGRRDVVELLLDRGAKPDLAVIGDGTALIAAAQTGRIELVRLLIDRGANPNVGVVGDGSPLIAAAGANRVEIVALLLDRGADIELVVPGDENALIQASEAGHLGVVRALVQRGANVNARVWASQGGRPAGEWRTPLAMARRGAHDGVAAFLLSAGARE
jgi:beta-lactamase regulating signal transducer with metallopeptidase domain